MIYFGVDPGKSGAIAAIWDDGQPFLTSCARGDWTEHEQAEWLLQFDLERARAVIEKVSSSPRQGVRSAFTFGRSYGFLRGLLAASKVSYQEVGPRRWQQAMHCLSGGDKNVTKAEAQRRWPRMKITHRNADAMLLAEYCRVESQKLQYQLGAAE